MKAILFTIGTRQVSWEEINLPMEVKDLYNENHKMLMKASRENTHKKGKISHVHGSEELILLK
jgi:hypothetical protein